MKILSQLTLRTWSILALVPMAIVCLGYGIFKRDLAKLHVNLPLLDVPFFVGEQLIAYMLFLSALFFCFSGKFKGQMKPSYVFLLLYLMWFIAKVLQGYWAWGSLAFRHAALFYYPVFFFFGYLFFNREIFTKWERLLLLVAITGLSAFDICDRYWTLTLSCLGGILILAIQEKPLKVVMFVLLALAVRYEFMVNIPRMMFFANVCSLSLLSVAVFVLLDIHMLWKVVGVSLLGLVLLLAFDRYFIKGESGRIFVSPIRLVREFRKMDIEVQENIKNYRMEAKKPELYHQESIPRKIIPPSALPPKPITPILPVHGTRDLGETKIDHALDRGQNLVSSSGQEVPKRAPQEKAKIPKKNIISLEQSGRPTATIQSSPRGTTLQIHDKEVFATTKPARSSEQDAPQTDVLSVSWESVNNILFRMFIWRDMYDDWAKRKPLWGVDFGKPFRSISLEAEHWAEREWGVDGWVDTHNSYFNCLYRSGIVGVVLIVVVWFGFARLVRDAFRRRSWILVLCCAILLNWLVAANFLSILEFPYTAIPFWTLTGLIWSYAYRPNMRKEERCYLKVNES